MKNNAFMYRGTPSVQHFKDTRTIERNRVSSSNRVFGFMHSEKTTT